MPAVTTSETATSTAPPTRAKPTDTRSRRRSTPDDVTACGGAPSDPLPVTPVVPSSRNVVLSDQAPRFSEQRVAVKAAPFRVGEPGGDHRLGCLDPARLLVFGELQDRIAAFLGERDHLGVAVVESLAG